MDNYPTKIKQIVQLQESSKKIIIYAEELGVNQAGFFPPVLQHRDALDHLCRAFAVHLELKEVPTKDSYIAQNIDKALGHLYRAFFDAADILSLTLRDRITTELKNFSQKAIRDCVPDYYALVRPKLEKVAQQIATIRQVKDIAISAEDIINECQLYEQELDFLIKTYKETSCLPSPPSSTIARRNKGKP